MVRAMVCHIHQNLKALLKHHGSQKVVRRRCVGRNNKERHLLFAAQLPQVDGIVRADIGNGRDVERTHAQAQRHIDALRGFSGCHFIQLVLFGGKGFRLSDAQILKNQVQLAHAVGVAVGGFQHQKQRHHAVHVAVFRLFLVKDIADQRFQQGGHALLPDGVCRGLCAGVVLEVLHKVFRHHKDIVLVFDVGKQIVVVGFVAVFQVKHLDRVSLCQQYIAVGVQQLALRIAENVVAVELQ